MARKAAAAVTSERVKAWHVIQVQSGERRHVVVYDHLSHSMRQGGSGPVCLCRELEPSSYGGYDRTRIEQEWELAYAFDPQPQPHPMGFKWTFPLAATSPSSLGEAKARPSLLGPGPAAS